MIINNLLSVPIYEFQCDESLINEISLLAIEDIYRKNQNNTITHDNFYHEKLFDWLDECTEKVKKIYFLDSIKLEITNCWFNKSKKLEYHHYHRHPNSIVSGILYLTTHDSGETVFYHTNPWREIGSNYMASIANLESSAVNLHTDFASLTEKIKPVKGKLILFPSSMTHGTRPNTDLIDRYSLSFNTYFSGEVAWGPGESCKMYVKTQSIRDQHDQ
jgi:uncharacterized protein (TIGR02466 family)